MQISIAMPHVKFPVYFGTLWCLKRKKADLSTRNEGKKNKPQLVCQAHTIFYERLQFVPILTVLTQNAWPSCSFIIYNYCSMYARLLLFFNIYPVAVMCFFLSLWRQSVFLFVYVFCFCFVYLL